MSTLLSIIIPTLNEEQFLPKLLSDLDKQKNKDFEILVIDGKSEDKTISLAKEFSKSMNIRILTVDKRNVAYQRNYGAEQAKGTYVLFLDADSRLGSNIIAKINTETTKSKYLAYIPALIPQGNTYHDKIIFNITNFLVEVSQVIGKPFSSGGSMIFQREFFLFLGGFNEKLFICEDHEIIQRARKRGVVAKVLPHVEIKFSLRRMKREGRLDVYRRYVIASYQLISNGSLEQKIFEYNMGGSGYNLIKENKGSVDKMIKNYFKRIKNQLEEFIS